LWLRAASGAAGLAFDVATQLLDRDRQVARPTTPATPAAVPRNGAAPQPAPTRTAESAAPSQAAEPDQNAPTRLEPKPAGRPAEEPTHVSEEPELVEEIAEPGAEEGAGAEVHIQEPWSGYTQSSAEDVIARLATASPAEVATVQLFESHHRARQTILAAVERELRRANGSGSPTPERNR